MKNNRCIKITAFMLVLCMMISILPGNVIALTDDSAESAETEQAVTPATEEKSLADEILEPIIVSEDITKRGENEKHFLCDDGSYIAVSYPQAVHEQVDGEWVDIEYDVTADGNGISPVDDTIKVKFANNTNSAKLVKLESGDYKISWTVEAENENGDITEKVKLSKDSKATLKTSKELLKDKKEKIKNNAKHTVEEVFDIKNNAKKTIEKLKTADTDVLKNNETVLSTNEAIQSYNCDRIQSILFAQSNIEYVGAFGEGTALRYIMSTGNINEEVVLESYNGFKSYSMVIDTDGLIPVKDEFGRIELVDKNENVIMMIKAPYMYDANDIISEDIEVTVTQESKKEWRITYTPDKEWLTDKERKYPVVIDPTVTTANYAQTNLLDTYVRSTQTAPYNNSSPHLYVGYNGGENWTYWGVKNLPGMNSVTTVTGASFNIRLLNGTGTMGRIGLYFVSSAITTSTMQWSNKPSIGTKLGEISTIPGDLWLRYSSNELGDKLRTYYRANWTDFGFALKYEAQINDWNQFYSSDYTGNGGANIPYLEVRYDSTYSNIKEGVYLLKNASSGKYISVSGAGIQLVDKSSNNPSIEWCIKENFYTDSSFDLLLNNDRSKKIYFDSNSGTAIMQTNDSDGFSKWFFEEVGNGRYVISSTGRPWMCLEGSGNQLKVSSNNSSLSQQWILDTYGFGSMEFRELHPSEYGLLNCHAYALMLNDINREWDYTTRQYILSLNNALPTSNIKNTVASLWKNDFEVWLSNNDYVYEYENNFSSNGESRYLGPNQYRIVMRTGYQVYTPASGTPVVLYDYHFWYQTYSGQWANKHGNGLTSYSASQLLPSGITPFSNNTSGWNYYITNGTSLEYEYVNFYDSQIYSYIITVQ